MTVKEETIDGLTATTEQTPTTRQQEETNIEPHQTGKCWAWGFCTPAEVLSLHKRQFGKSKLVFRSFQVA